MMTDVKQDGNPRSPTPSVAKYPAAAGLAADPSGGNATAIEAISERLSEVTSLAEQLDRALTEARLDPSAPPPPPSVEDANDVPGDASGASTAAPLPVDTKPEPSDSRSVATMTEEWRPGPSAAPERESEHGVAVPRQTQLADDKSESDDLITASECTCSPPSRSSSFHTASEGVTSPWWEVDPASEDGDDDRPARGPVRTSKQVQTMNNSTEDTIPLAVPAAAATFIPEVNVKTVVQHHLHHLPDREIHPGKLEEDEREVLVGVLTQRELRETRQLRVRRGGGETRAESELACSRIEAQHLNNACNASTSSTASASSTLSSGTRGALDALLHAGHDDVDAADAEYRQRLEESLPLPLPLDLDLQLPSPLAFADPPTEYAPEYASEYDVHLAQAEHAADEDMPPPPPQELLDGLKEVSLRDENANLLMLEPPPPPPPPPQHSGSVGPRFLCQPHIMRHAIKGVF